MMLENDVGKMEQQLREKILLIEKILRTWIGWLADNLRFERKLFLKLSEDLKNRNLNLNAFSSLIQNLCSNGNLEERKSVN